MPSRNLPSAAAMEGSTDALHAESEATAAAAGGMEQPGAANGLEMPKGAAAEPDGGAESKACPAKEGGCCGPPCAEGPAAGAPQPGGEAEAGAPPALEPAVPPPSEGPPQRPPKLSIAELDCLICFHRFSACRLPKLLACQHAFCAVCLKLILRSEEQGWVITCPLCRRATPVLGGLICSLRDKEDLLGRLEEPCPPEPAGRSPAHRQADPRGREPPAGEETSQVAAKRLLLLLLLLAAVLLALVLPFLYSGLLKWVLCSLAALGLLVSGLLFCNPRWGRSGLRLPPWRRKESQVASVA